MTDMIWYALVFVGGAAAATVIWALFSNKLEKDRRYYRKQLSEKQDTIRSYELNKAFLDGVKSGGDQRQALIDQLVEQRDYYCQQNKELMGQLGQETIFANTVAKSGGAVVALQRKGV